MFKALFKTLFKLPILGSILAMSIANSAIAAPANPSDFPTQAMSVSSLIAPGWKIESQTKGDLNGDQQPELVLRLIESGASSEKFGEYDRALLILQQNPQGQWKRMAIAPRLLLCQGCGGMLGTPTGHNIRIDIKQQVITVQQLRGSRNAVQTIHRFWLDPKTNQIVSIGLDVKEFDRAQGDETRTSSNFLTGEKITEQYRPNQNRTGKTLVTRQRSSIPKQTTRIEAIDIDQI